MKSKIVPCVLTAIVCIFCTLWFVKPSEVIDDTAFEELRLEIETLQDILDDLAIERDSLMELSNNIEKQIIVIREEHEKVFNGIVEFSAYEHMEFFSEYLSKNVERLYSRINAGTAKDS